MAKWNNIRHFATCNHCGKSLADKPSKQKYCSLKCCTDAKIGIDREDCRVHRECKCGKTGWGSHFWNNARGMCWECCEVTPKRKPNGGHKNRVYKTCDSCGFVGYGVKLFPFDAKGLCLRCWRKKTGYPIKIPVKDKWDKWANQEGNRFFKYERKKVKNKGTLWDAWATQKSTNLASRLLHGVRKRVVPRVICNWNECFDIGMARLKQQAKDKEMDRWNRKCCSWVRSLATRQKQQAVKNCEN